MYSLLDYVLHLDTHVTAFVMACGSWTYLVLFLVIFCETGLVITPFLPGDSLLFAVGSFAAQPNSPLDISFLFGLLIVASVSGNQVNYKIGRFFGPAIFTARTSWLLNKNHLQRAHLFYEKNGGKTIVIARFLPIIRTFVPFVAGISGMKSAPFFYYNALSAVLWIGSLLGFGYCFGTLPMIKNHFSVVIYGILVLSLMPPCFAFFYSKVRRRSN